MKILEKDKFQADHEKKEKEKKDQDDKTRQDYLAKMRNNRYFQKYIIDGIIRKNINDVLDLNKIPNGNYEEMGKLLFEAKLVKSRLEKMLADILNS